MKKLLGTVVLGCLGLCGTTRSNTRRFWDKTRNEEFVNKENASKLWKMIKEAGDYLLC